MSSNDPISNLLSQKPTITLDGALATELEARGLDLSSALWSATILQHSPDAVYQVHRDYFRAGADVAITASYQASHLGLQQHLGFTEPQARDLVRSSVRLAQRARDDVLAEETKAGAGKQAPARMLLVAGSVGPYGAYLANGSEYRGDYALPESEMRDFHRPRIQALLQAGADVLALETMPSFAEIRALLGLLETEFPAARAWVSCTLRDAETLSDGTAMREVVDACQQSSQVVAVGVNCIPERDAMAALRHLNSLTRMPLVVYPNSGESWDAEKRAWTGERAQGEGLREVVLQWPKEGARLIGGCCRTRPQDIEVIRDALS